MHSLLRFGRRLMYVLTPCVLLLAEGCASVKECAGTSAEGNLGSAVNSPYDEFAPVFYGARQLLFTSNREGGTSAVYKDSLAQFGEDIYSSDFLRDGFAPPELVHNPPLNTFANDGSASFCYNASRNVVEMFFTSFSDADTKTDADIYVCEFANGQWGNPAALSVLNSSKWDAQPAVSPDGTMIIFGSDRDGGEGGIDLYVSTRTEEGRWSMPVNMGSKINSRFDDITPLLSEDNALYYSTQVLSASRTFDIVMATLRAGAWTEPVALPFPINTQFDEISPAAWGDSLLFASNRTGGCGGYDLYAMHLCNDVIVRGEVLSPAHMAPNDFVVISREDGTPLKTVPVRHGVFETTVPSRSTFVLRYANECYDGEPIEQTIETPCAVDPVVVRTRFEIPDRLVRLTFDTYEIPFFVTGYYLPNTTENLEDLRLRFAYNLFGSNDSTRYIEFPGDMYDGYASEVDRAMSEAVETIRNEFVLFDNPCGEGPSMLDITIEGFADPRGFTPVARYAGAEIADADQGVFARPGSPMDNQLLSTLRAYYSMLTIRSLLERMPDYNRYREKLRFRVVGSGVSDEETPFELQRKIVVTVKPSA